MSALANAVRLNIRRRMQHIGKSYEKVCGLSGHRERFLRDLLVDGGEYTTQSLEMIGDILGLPVWVLTNPDAEMADADWPIPDRLWDAPPIRTRPRKH